MANDYFNYENPLTRHTLGRAEQVNATFNAIEAAFDKLPTPDQINQGSVSYVLDIGTANSYVVNFSRVPEAYAAGMNFTMKAATTNTGASVINVNGLGVKQIRRYDGSALEAGDIRAGQMVLLGYDGSRFLIMGVHGGEVAKARQWASSTTLVEGGLYGARGYAQQADRWANENLGVVVEGGRYSAKHWALRAEINAGLLPDENNDIPARVYRDLGTSAEPFRNLNLTGIATASAYRTTEIAITGYQIRRMSDSGVMVISGGDSQSSGAIIQLFANGLGRLRSGTSTLLQWNADGATFTQPLRVNADLTLGPGSKFTGDGSGLTNVDASNISSGTLPNARLSGDYSFANLNLSGTATASSFVTANARFDGDTIRRRNTDGPLYVSAGTSASSGANIQLFAGGDVRGRLRSATENALEWTPTAVIARKPFSVTADLTVTSAGRFIGNGSGLTNLNASNISSGTVPAARLPNHSANLLTSGTLPAGRLSGNYSFGNLTLSGSLTTGGDVQVNSNNINIQSNSNKFLRYLGGTGTVLGSLYLDQSDGRIVLRVHDASGSALHGLSLHRDGRATFSGTLEVGGNPVATVSTTGSASTTNFPIGHNIMVYTAGTNYARNASETIRLDGDANERYRRGGSGTVLSGTWRSRGYVYGSDGNVYMFQRMA